MPCGATQDGRVMVERSDTMWSTKEANGKPFQYPCLENPMNSRKRQNDRILKKGTPQVIRCPICYWRSVEKLLQKELRDRAKAKKQHQVMDVIGDGSKVWCCKEQNYIGTWNVRSMNQGKLKVVKQEMARVNTGILGISELNGWILLMIIISATVGKNPLEEME